MIIIILFSSFQSCTPGWWPLRSRCCLEGIYFIWLWKHETKWHETWDKMKRISDLLLASVRGLKLGVWSSRLFRWFTLQQDQMNHVAECTWKKQQHHWLFYILTYATHRHIPILLWVGKEWVSFPFGRSLLWILFPKPEFIEAGGRTDSPKPLPWHPRAEPQAALSS